MNKTKTIISVLFLSCALTLVAQVKDVSFTVSPLAEHVWWNKNLTLDNSTFWGARAGFGFGPLFEIRGFYEQSFDVKTSLRGLNWSVTDNWADKMVESKVNISRYGGELKLNLWKDALFAPYITLGSGIQKLKYDIPTVANPAVTQEMKEENLFTSVGLGTKLNLSDRVVLSLEAKNTFFNVSDGSYYLKPDFKLNDDNRRMHNWSALASLDFYFGGTGNDANNVARAYHNLFTDGFNGIKFVVEPGGAYIDFKDDSPFTDQFFLGGQAGFDFSSLVGIRGFYYQATKEPGKLSFNFNNELSMYGGNIIARLNQPRGVTPYITLGGGYLKVGADSLNTKTADVKSAPFALGGLGVEVPLSRHAALFGSVNLMFTMQDGKKAGQISQPSEVRTNTMYNAGLRVNLGRSANADAVYSRSIAAEREAGNQAMNAMRADYQARINRLEAELDEANLNNDHTAATAIMQEKQRAEAALDNIDTRAQAVSPTQDKLVRITQDDLDEMVSRVIREIRRETPAPQPYYYNNVTPAPAVAPAMAPVQAQDNAEVVKQLSDLNNKLDRNFDQMARVAAAGNKAETVVVTGAGGTTPVAQPYLNAPTSTGLHTPATAAAPGAKGGIFKWNRVAVYTGPGFGDLFTWNVGVRGYMQISNTHLDFVPELYTALGSKSGIGLSGNVVYNFDRLIGGFSPYAGFGLGVFHGAKTHAGANIILGVEKNGFFADYSIRTLFKQNQIAAGYRFVF